MISNNIYLFQVTLTWGLLYGFYWLFLGKETFFKTNRWYLLGALFVGLILPYLQESLQHTSVGMQVIQLPEITITNLNANQSIVESVNSKASVKYWLSIVYWVGVVVLSLRFLRDLIGIVWLIRSGRNEKNDGSNIVHIERDMAPFSFFNYLFVFDKDRFTDEEWSQVLLHEKTHITQYHSIDIVFTEVLKIAFWWNPIIYLYQRSLREVHEYEADYAVRNKNNTKQYGLLLMKQSLSGSQVAVANSFINSQLKKRIIMMTKKRSNSLAKFKYIWTLPLLTLLFFISFGNQVLAQNIPVIAEEIIDTVYVVDPDTYEETMSTVKNTYYKNKNLDKTAILEGCELERDAAAQKKCSNSKLLNTLYKTVQYPTEARAAGVGGRVVVKILIDFEGKASYKLLRDPGFNLGAEVIRTFHAMDLKWRPAVMAGKKVNVEFMMPVLFKLEGGDEPFKDKSQSAFSDVKVRYTGTDLKVDFNYADGADEHINMIVYDQMGQFLYTNAGTVNSFSASNLQGKSDFIIVVLEDAHGNKAVRRVALAE